MGQPMVNANDSSGERPVARVRFSINISGRPAGRPYDIVIFGTASLSRHLLGHQITDL
jgi:hypothetical protein